VIGAAQIVHARFGQGDFRAGGATHGAVGRAQLLGLGLTGSTRYVACSLDRALQAGARWHPLSSHVVTGRRTNRVRGHPGHHCPAHPPGLRRRHAREAARAAHQRSRRLRLHDRLSIPILLHRYPRRSGSRALLEALRRRGEGSTITKSQLEELLIDVVDEFALRRPETNVVLEVGGVRSGSPGARSPKNAPPWAATSRPCSRARPPLSGARSRPRSRSDRAVPRRLRSPSRAGSRRP
jgi:hypothetical protein